MRLGKTIGTVTLVEPHPAVRGGVFRVVVPLGPGDLAAGDGPAEPLIAWDDLGGWSAVARQRGGDAEGNTVVGRHLGIDSTRTIVHSDDRHLVVTMGLDDMIVVHTDDATLVASRAHEESVRRVVAELEKRGWTEFL